MESSLDKNYSILFQHMDPKRDSIEADFLTNCAFWDMQMRSLARFSDFLGQVLEFLHTVVQASEADLKKID